jgi:hypothetical protein
MPIHRNMCAQGVEPRLIAAPLALRLGSGVGVDALACAFVAVWQDVDAALRPVIGPRGVAALFDRTAHAVGARHAWLGHARQNPAAGLDVAPLQALFAQQSGEQALAGANDFLMTFHELLVTLIGAALTERLLRSAWGPASVEAAATEPAP